jgi:hypothetical protein
VPPDLALTAPATGQEFGSQDAVKHHARKRIAWLSRNQVCSGRTCPDLEEFFGRHLVRDVPMGDARFGCGRQHVVADPNAFLELDATPVLGQLRLATLNGERRIRYSLSMVKKAQNMVSSRCSQAAL